MSSAIPWVGTPGKGGDFVKNDMQRTQITPCTRGMTSIKVEIFPLLPRGVTDTKRGIPPPQQSLLRIHIYRILFNFDINKFQLSTSVTCMYHTDFGSLTQLKTFKLLRTNLKLFINFHTLETLRLPFSPSG